VLPAELTDLIGQHCDENVPADFAWVHATPRQAPALDWKACLARDPLHFGRMLSAFATLQAGQHYVRRAVIIGLLVLWLGALIGWITGATASVASDLDMPVTAWWARGPSSRLCPDRPPS
jgi:hypothetical protein